MKYAEHVTQSRRLALLRVLAEAPGYAANESVLHTAATALGFRESRDQIRGDIAWLAEPGLLTVEDVSGIMVATLNRRGLDVATGAANHPGVARPGPGG